MATEYRADQTQDAHPIPDGGYGWVCVGSCFAVNALTWGVGSTYGVYLSYYLSSSSFPTASSTDFALIGGLTYAASMFAAPFVTLCARSVGRTQPPMFIGVLFQGAGYVAASFASKIWHLYLSQGILVGLGIGFLYIPSIAIIPQWFDRKRSLASAVSASGSGIGGLVFALSTGKMIRDLSLAWALRITGIVLTTASFVAVSLVRDRDNIIQPEQSLFSLKILRKGQVLLLLAWAFISLFGYITIQFSMSAFARSIGLDAAQADLVTALLSTGTACGRPIGGFASDYFGRIKVAVVLTFATGIFCFAIWLPADSLGVTCLFAILAGGIYGIFWASIGPLCAEVVGLKKLPSLLSLSWLISIVPTLFGEVISLRLRRPGSAGEYLYPQIFSGLSYMVAGLFLWQLGRLKRNT